MCLLITRRFASLTILVRHSYNFLKVRSFYSFSELRIFLSRKLRVIIICHRCLIFKVLRCCALTFLPQQRDYYFITLIFLCQHFFKKFFNIFLPVFFTKSCIFTAFLRAFSTASLYYHTLHPLVNTFLKKILSIQTHLFECSVLNPQN